ncbi:MAG: Cna B-type domain-containing protein, partial [Acutalibacteraceae bacterium]|nr:Cna B-type domain-containing protein [Acutalibacteraceae bacterium]
MKERLQRILSVVCVLALVLGCMTVPALSDGNTKIVTVIWNDSNNTEGVRPDSVTVGGVALNEGNGWTGVIETEDGSVTVPAVAGYDKSESGDDIIKVTYTHALRTTNVQGSVNWEDNKNAKQVRPGTLSLQLLADGVPCRPSAKVGESNSWSATWDKVPMFKYGTNDQVTYTVALVSKPAGYTVSGEGQGKEITCTLQTGTLQVKGEYIDVPEGSDTS